jgi:hypothetical protein
MVPRDGVESLQLFLPCQLLVPKVAPRLRQNGNLRCLMHKEMNYLCIRHLRFLFQPSLGATIGTNSWHEGITAIMKMAVWELREKLCETNQQQTTDRPVLQFGHFFSPRAGPRRREAEGDNKFFFAQLGAPFVITKL